MPPKRKKSERRGAPKGLRAALREDSRLHVHVQAGIQALKAADRGRIDDSLRPELQDSVDLDGACEREDPEANRWDYVLGKRDGEPQLLGIEVHPATPKEVSRLIKKKLWATQEMGKHLRAGHRVAMWFWVASGRDGLSRNTTEYRQLVNSGIVLVGGTLHRDDLKPK